MFCIVIVICLRFYCNNGMCTCFVLWQWYVYMLCIVLMVRVHGLQCESSTRE